MRRIGSVQITTTPALEGWTVREYLGPVTTHLVAGAGKVGEILSGLADLLASRSVGHSDRLGRLAEEAIGRLRSEVISRGGNALVGLRLDYRELSAGGRSLLLVAASGTAAEAEPLEGAAAAPAAGGRARAGKGRGKPVLIAGAAVRDERRRQALLRRLDAGETQLDDEDWEFLVTQRVRGLGPRVLAIVRDALHREPDDAERKRIIAAALDYFRILRAEEASGALYPALAGEEGLAYFVLHLIEQLDLFDPKRVRQLIAAGEAETARRTLQTVRAEKRFYDHVDLEEIERLAAEVRGAFPVLAEVAEEKSLLSSGTRRVWICAECHHRNAESRPRCSECGRDRYGFPGGFLDPEEAEALLAERASALRACLGEEAGS